VLSPDHKSNSDSGFLKGYGSLSLALLPHLMSGRFDLVHAHWAFPSGMLGAALASVRNRPLLLTEHGTYSTRLQQKGRFARWIAPGVMRRANHIIWVGEGQPDALEAAGTLIASPQSVIPMGIHYPETLISREEARMVLGIAPTTTLLLFAGNLEYHKGPDILLEAIAGLVKAGIRCHAVFAGQGPAQADLKAMTDGLNILANVQFIGGKAPERLGIWRAAADICVVPSRQESFGLAAFEAMASGSAVVASAIGEMKRAITHGENGFLFPAGNVQALQTLLQHLISDPDRVVAVTGPARQTAARLRYEDQAERVLSLYQQLTTAI
jgi:glycosyltransferase involved in cell wall biosynthesis